MAERYNPRDGMNRIVGELKKQFRIAENLEFYSPKDYQEAEKKYLKFCLRNGCGLKLPESS